MKKYITLILALLIFCHPGFALGESKKRAPFPEKEIILGVTDDVLADYHLFLAGRAPLSITDYSGPHSRRDVVEVVLFQQALALGGLPTPIRFKAVPTYRRLGAELREGIITGAATSFWLNDLEEDLELYRISKAVIENGQFEAGLYTNTDNARAMDANTLAKIQTLSAASNKYWIPDWTTLRALNLDTLTHIQKWTTMVRMVFNQRADFLLAPFQQTDGMLLSVDNMTLTPIPGVKVGLHGSRHFVVSKPRPNSDQIFKALQKGLAIMKSQGTINRAYRHSGFFNHNAKDWLMLNK